MPDFATIEAPDGYEWGAKERHDSKRPAGDWRHLDLRGEQPFDFEPFRDRSIWRDIDLSYVVGHVGGVFDQLDGHCTANQCTMGQMVIAFMASGRKRRLAPESLYRQHSRDGTGSTLWENVEYAAQYGILTREQYPHRGGSFYRGWDKDAVNFRLHEWWDINGDMDGVAVALQCGFPVGIGCSRPAFGGPHSVLTTGFERASDPDDDLFWGPNSWGEYDGGHERPGFWKHTRRTLVRSGAARYSSYAYLSTVIAGGEETPPVPE